jgi:hypothetical protein
MLGRLGAVLSGLAWPGASAQPGAGRYPDGAAFRDDVLRRYPFTDPARRLLRGVDVRVKNLREPRGGGLWYGPRERRIVLEGVQDEAAVHELAHAWADLAGFYEERKRGGPPWPTLNLRFRAAVKRAAEEADPRYRRVRRVARQYEYGDPAIGFRGMFENDSERFAGLASATMGDLGRMPPYLAAFYQDLFAASENDRA